MPLMLCFPSAALKGKYLGLFQLCRNTYFTVSADLCVYSQFNAVGFAGSLYALMQLLVQCGFPAAECKILNPSRREFNL